MTIRAAALLVVLTLTGTPVAAAACLLVCGSPGAVAASCHDGPVDPHDGPSLLPAHHCDIPLLGADPWLVTAKRLAPAPAGDSADALPATLRERAAPAALPCASAERRPFDAPAAGTSLSVILRI